MMSLKKLVDTRSVEAFFQSASKPVRPKAGDVPHEGLLKSKGGGLGFRV